MDKSIFTNKQQVPAAEDLAGALGTSLPLWTAIADYVYEQYPAAKAEWNFPGEKYGWSFRLKDKKRAIVYLLPRDGFFKVAFVFGQKATDQVMQSGISTAIKNDLQAARPYAEGRGIRIDVKSKSILKDIKTLVDIKLAN